MFDDNLMCQDYFNWTTDSQYLSMCDDALVSNNFLVFGAFNKINMVRKKRSKF